LSASPNRTPNPPTSNSSTPGHAHAGNAPHRDCGVAMGGATLGVVSMRKGLCERLTNGVGAVVVGINHEIGGDVGPGLVVADGLALGCACRSRSRHRTDCHREQPCVRRDCGRASSVRRAGRGRRCAQRGCPNDSGLRCRAGGQRLVPIARLRPPSNWMRPGSGSNNASKIALDRHARSSQGLSGNMLTTSRTTMRGDTIEMRQRGGHEVWRVRQQSRMNAQARGGCRTPSTAPAGRIGSVEP
jgi:hypothetical protein